MWSGAATVSGLAAYLGLPKGRTAATGIPVPTTGTLKASPQAAGMPGLGFPHEGFLANLGNEFRIKLPGGVSGSCRLIEVSPTTEMKTVAGNFSCFSLTFEARPGMLPDGGVCLVSHPDLEGLEMFLSPVGRNGGDKALLEAAFTLRS